MLPSVLVLLAALGAPHIARAQLGAVAEDDSFTVAEDSGNTEFDVLANDTDLDAGILRIVAIGTPVSGTVEIQGRGGNRLRYRPDDDFAGVDTFTYTIENELALTATATVTVTVTGVDDTPIAADDSFTVDEDAPGTSLAVLANDSDPDGTPVTIVAVGSPDQGGAVAIAPDGLTLVYTAAADFNGEESFTYTIEDSTGNTAEAEVTVTVTAVGDPPAAADDEFTVGEGSSANELDVLANDTSPDGAPLTITAVDAGSAGTVAIVPGGDSLSYTPAPGFAGVDSFGYTVAAADGALASAGVTVTVIAVNDPPTANGDRFDVAEDSPGESLDVLGNDTDPDPGDALTIVAVGMPDQGGSVATAAGATALRYIPAAEFSGLETFEYTISDEAGATAAATVVVNVVRIDDPPRIDPDPIPAQTVTETRPVLINLAQFVSDADSPPESLLYALAADSGPLPPGLTLAPTGLISGTPTGIASVGEHSVRFAVSDGTTTTNSQSFTLNVLGLGRVDLAVTLSATPNPAGTNELVTWTAAVTNAAPETGVPGVLLELVVGGEAPFVADEPSTPECTPNESAGATRLNCLLSSFMAGAAMTEVSLTGRAIQAGDVVATATVAVDGAEPIDEVPGNDSATTTLSVAQSIGNEPAQRIGGIAATAVAAGDIDGDGFTDLIVATNGSGTLLLRNVADPANSAKRRLAESPQALGPPGRDNDVAIADIDSDGDPDLVAAGASGTANILLVNDGTGGFATTSLGAAAAESFSVTAADVDGDGLVDLVFGAAGGNLLYRGIGGSGFATPRVFGGGDTRDVAIVNLPGSSLPAVILANADGNAQVFRAAGGLLVADGAIATGAATAVHGADFNGDGIADLAFARDTAASSGSNLIYLNTSAVGASFLRSAELGNASTIALAGVDADMDGDPDLVFVNRNGAHQLLLNSAVSTAEFVLHPRQIAERAVVAVATGLIGADARPDLVLAGPTGIAVFYNDGSGNFGQGDVAAPSLSLVGAARVVVPVSGSYTDAGATATDPEDGDVSARIVVTNPVNTGAVGTYTVRYEVTDTSGNAATPITRTVTVQAAQNSSGGGGGATGAVTLALLALLGLMRRLAPVAERRPSLRISNGE